jgi:hypothetical protein
MKKSYRIFLNKRLKITLAFLNSVPYYMACLKQSGSNTKEGKDGTNDE